MSKLLAPGYRFPESALSLLGNSLNNEDRIVVTGATGWFGRTLACALEAISVPTMYLSSKSRKINLPCGNFETNLFELSQVKAFRPTVLVDFAFLTRGLEAEAGVRRFTVTNRALIAQALSIFKLETVRAAVFVSSGAVDFGDFEPITNRPNLYGRLKRETETRFREASIALEKPALGLKTWSVSGGLAPDLDKYAFGSIVQQALKGRVLLHSPRKVFRRYSSLEDLLSVGFALTPDHGPKFTLLESGGELVDLEALANLALTELNVPGEVVSTIRPDLPSDYYASDNEDWMRACADLGYEPADIGLQIKRLANSIDY